MEYVQYSDIKAFYNDVYALLREHEAQNIVMLGNTIMGNEGKYTLSWRDPSRWYMAAVWHNGFPLLIALMTPPYNLTLYARDNNTNDEAIDCLVQGVMDNGLKIPGVMSVPPLAERFANKYSAAKHIDYRINRNQRIYELLTVNPKIPQIGRLRPARESDLAFLPYWIGGFNSDCSQTPLTVSDDISDIRYRIEHGAIYILEDNGTPVAISSISKTIVTVGVVSYVYTPPFFRGMGYASSCVAAVSRIVLDRGYKRCILYTDLANPTSNSIYQKIGYTPLNDSIVLDFI